MVDGLLFYRTPSQGSFTERLPLLNQYVVVEKLTKRLQKLTERESPDVLHAHSPCLNGIAALRVGRRLGVPVVYELRASWEDAAVNHGWTTEGSLRYRVSRRLETYVLRRADAVTTICDGLRKEILSRGVSADRVTLIPNAVEPSRFRSGAEPDSGLRCLLGLEGEPVLGFIGSFYAYEGLAVLLEALPLMLEKLPKLQLLLVGGGPEEGTLKRAVTSRGLQRHVIFAGRAIHEDVPRYYGLVDAMIYPRISIRLTELVTPLKPLEAMANGCLVVASDVGGHRELIRDGETGHLFRPGDSSTLAEAVLNLLDRREDWPRLRKSARAFVEAERSWSRSVSGYAAVYERLVKAPTEGRKSSAVSAPRARGILSPLRGRRKPRWP